MANQPDVLLILTDQWNPRMLGCAGDPLVRTPNIDALAAEGTLFQRAYTQSPVCMAARCSLASGRYPHNHGFWGNFTGQKFPAEAITLFHDIQRAGYSTAKIGKYHFFNLAWGEDYRDHQAYYETLGLDWAQELPTPYMGPFLRNEYTEHLQQRGLLDGYMADVAERFAIGDFDVVRQSPLPPDDHQDGYITQQALAYMARCTTEKPMFLCVSLPGPHTPFDAPGHYAEMFDPQEMVLAPNVPAVVHKKFDQAHIRKAQANYYGKLAHLDDRVGELVTALKARGTWENTLLIFAADHGEYLGSHGKMAKGGFEEESARIPLLMRWPGHIVAGQQSDALAQWIDIYPTIVEAIGGVISPQRFGKSLLPVASGATTSVHDAVFSEIGSGEHLNYMVRTAQYKWFVHNGQEQLFDLEADPYELNNLIHSPAAREVVPAMKQRLLDFLMQTQVNHSASYQNLFTRIGLRGGEPTEMAERLLTMFRQVHHDN